MQKLKKDYYPLEEVAKEYPPYTVNDLLYFGETGQLQMCVVLPPTIVEITRLTPINELDENSYWAKLMNEPHEDSEKAKGEDLPEFIHECVKMGEIAGRYHLFAVDVISIYRGDGIASVHDGNFDTNRMHYRFLNDNGRPANKNFNVTDIVISYEEKMRFEKECGSDKPLPKSKQSVDEFVRSLTIYPENDETINIQISGRKAEPFTGPTLGCHKTGKEWGCLQEIIREGSYCIRSTKTMDEDARRKRLTTVNKKIIKFLNKEFDAQIPPDYKLFEKSIEDKKKNLEAEI